MQLGCGGRRDCAEAVVVVKIGVNDMVERNSDATLVARRDKNGPGVAPSGFVRHPTAGEHGG